MSHHRGSDEMTSPFTPEIMAQLEAEQVADYAEIEQAARLDELIGDFLATCRRRGFSREQVATAVMCLSSMEYLHERGDYRPEEALDD
jgi:hypothetical protein